MSLCQLQLSLQFARDLDGATKAELRSLLSRARVRKWLRHALADEGEFTVRVVGEVEGRALNLSYRQKDYATNVLTFDYSREPLLADIVLCAPVVASEAKAQGKSLEAHFAHLLVHAALHAQGWEHETNAEDAREMEAYEVSILAELGYPNPYH